jgi:hypothetical protein
MMTMTMMVMRLMMMEAWTYVNEVGLFASAVLAIS